MILLVILLLIFGSAIANAPLRLLQLTIGVLLLLFGLRWLRKAILRAAGIIALHDEERAFARQTDHLREEALRRESRLDWLAGVTACKAVVIEGVEVVFIVIAVGAGRGLLVPASFGSLAACALVALIGVFVRRPLARVPENALKFCVGIMLSAFGVFWTGEGLGVAWPGADLAVSGFIALFLAVALVLVRIVQARVLRASS
jgi:Ca2+/H+ antiporter, TMEM165/GDT1 family